MNQAQEEEININALKLVELADYCTKLWEQYHTKGVDRKTKQIVKLDHNKAAILYNQKAKSKILAVL